MELIIRQSAVILHDIDAGKLLYDVIVSYDALCATSTAAARPVFR
jgi:hypothetical protein